MKKICILNSDAGNIPDCDLYFALDVLVEERLHRLFPSDKIRTFQDFNPPSWDVLHRDFSNSLEWSNQEQRHYFANLIVHESTPSLVAFTVVSEFLQQETATEVLLGLDPNSAIACGAETALRAKGVSFAYVP